MSLSTATGQRAEIPMTDVLDDALRCIAGNRYSRRRNHWGSPTGRRIRLDTVATLKQRMMIELRRDDRGHEHPFVTAVGEARLSDLKRAAAKRSRRKADAEEVSSCA